VDPARGQAPAVLQHIGDAVRAGLPYWGVCLGVQLLAASPGARVFAGERAEGAARSRSDDYEQQAFRVQRAYGLQLHLEIVAALASEWGAVPAYAQSLGKLLGDEGLPTLVEQVRRHQAETAALARRLFAAWLEHASA
jgi:GMP synthase (glutamine-hydrolysing)